MVIWFRNRSMSYTEKQNGEVGNMSMNGIDISSYQKGIDLSVVPCDFVIIKATQGTSYINPDFNRAITQAIKEGKLIGIYHYANGSGATAEADFFIKIIKDYVGKAILVIDWESDQNDMFNASTSVSYVKAFCDRVYQRTGVKPLVYMSKSVCRTHNWSSVAKDYGLWVAQYANIRTTGYQADPWTDAKGYGAWKSPAIFQYSSRGRLSGWLGNLDLDIAYMDKEGWMKYANPNNESYNDEKKEYVNIDAKLPILSEGSTGTAVKVLQTVIGANPDGIFGMKTDAKVREFQLKHGLAIDGIVGVNTWTAIMKLFE